MITRSQTFTLGQDEPVLPEHIRQDEKVYQQIKTAIHQELVASLDLSKIGRVANDQIKKMVLRLAEKACQDRKVAKANIDRDRLLRELMDEIFGLGPLEAVMQDPNVTDILVNDSSTVYVERCGRLELTEITFADEAHLVRIIQRIVARLGRRIDEVSPMVDARLPDGSRVNAVIRPLAIDGPSLSIRRFGVRPLEIRDLLSNHSLTGAMADFLRAVIEARLGIVISGGTGAGKTTLLSALTQYIPSDERIVTIEDSAELLLQHKHAIRLETRPENTEGKGEITQRDLVRNSLRMRPDRIIVGEARGAEVWDMLQAMNTGHEGSLTTIHANNSGDALMRMEMMVAMTGFEMPVNVVRQYVAAGISLVVHVARLKGGIRRVTQISEIVGVQNGEFQLVDLFRFEQSGVSLDGIADGSFVTTGAVPTFLPRMEAAGVSLPTSTFAARRVVCPSQPQVRSE
jgi:pilus assembly protein CpaF